jgi:hypothetical protein
LQTVPTPAKRWPVPVHAPGTVMLQLDPQQHAPRHSAPGVQIVTGMPLAFRH